MTDCCRALEMSVFPFMVFLFFSNELVLASLKLAKSELPERITTLSGSCVQIPCRFNGSEIKFKNTQSISGVWIKKIPKFGNPGSLVVFNGSSNIINGFSRIEILGNLSRRDCTTVFYDIMNNHSDNYFFRVETKTPGMLYTYQNPIYISVSDKPQPLILKPTDLKEVMENTTVNLSCSAEAPCPKQPPTISWSNIPEPAHITTQLQEKPDKTQSVFSHMTFRASYMDHRKNISCTVTYPRNTPTHPVETTVMLQVLFPPKETHITIDPSAPVSVGTNVTLTCKSKANPSNNMNYTWYKCGQETPIARGKEISFTVTHNNTGSYFCIAQNKHGNQSSTKIQLTSEGKRGFSHLVIYGCTGGLFAFILLSAVFYYCMRTKTSSQAHGIRRDQATDKNSDIVTIYANSSIAIRKKSEKEEADDLHYGEIDFSKFMTREHSNNGPQTEYAEIQVTANNKKTNIH